MDKNTNPKRGSLIMLAVVLVPVLICISIAAFMCSEVCPIVFPPAAQAREFDYAELLIVNNVAPSNWKFGLLSRGEADAESDYDSYLSYHFQVFQDDESVMSGFFNLYCDDTLSPNNYSNFSRFIYMPEGPAIPELTPTMQYAEQWEMKCAISEPTNTETCKLIASYQEVLLLMILVTDETLRFEDYPIIMEQIVGMLEAQDQHIGEMLNLASSD